VAARQIRLRSTSLRHTPRPGQNNGTHNRTADTAGPLCRRAEEETISAPDRPNRPLTYKEAGVDIDAADRLIDFIKPLTKSTVRPGADGAIGGFGGVFDPKAAGFKDPVFVAATDGVGTKLRLAIDTGNYAGVGTDLVAMCVNDLVVQVRRDTVLPRLLRHRQA